MTITQGLYYIEKVHQYNSNIAGFPSDLIDDRIASIIDSNKSDMQQSLRCRPVKIGRASCRERVCQYV